MKADFSRDTFEPKRHYRRVLDQQGRVVNDADRNEQTSIDIGITEQTTFDVIGPTGVPETSFSAGYTGGFQIGISADKSDLTISHGRMYVDGLLVENDADTTLTTQPFLPLSKNALGPAGISGAGVYGVYLDAWERLITSVDDPHILETALGGPDTSLRSQIAWQVKLGQIDTHEFGNNPSCAEILPPWGPGFTGMLAARGGAPSTDPLPCVLPPQTGFRSFENQLYRVEIHTGGGYGTATFKWSRENGSVIAGIVSQLTGSYSSPTFNVQSVGRDATLGFKTGDWVELIDDRSEFQTGVGQLLQVGIVDAANQTISLQAAPTLTVDASLHPKLRRWDQTKNAGATGIPIVDGSWIDLENGVQIQFSNNQFEVGAYWLIPARTATSNETVGTVEWPIDPTTGAPAFEPPRGIVHYYTKLAIVAFDRQLFAPPQGSGAVNDCRIFFPPLTAIQTQESPCTLVLTPGTDWVGKINALFTGSPALDAELCFTVGEFSATQPVIITTTGNVKVSGAGWGTKLVGTGIESVLQFNGCASAIVRDLYASASTVDAPPDAPATKASKMIHGALDFNNCGEVLVENVSLQCGAALLPGAACLVVRSDATMNVTTGTGIARVRGSTFAVGEMQYGILLVHQHRAFVERNRITALQTSGIKWSVKLQQPVFQQQLVHVLLGNAAVFSTPKPGSSSSASSSSSHAAVPAPPTPAGVPPAAGARAEILSEAAATQPKIAPGLAAASFNAGVTVAGKTVQFNAPGPVGEVFQTYADLNGPKEFATQGDLYKFVQKSALTLVTNPAAQAQFPSLQSFLGSLQRSDAVVGARGIAVGGQAITELRIHDNSIDFMLQGITVGVSHKEKRPPSLPANSIQNVTIAGNVIDVVLNAVSGRSKARWAIFVGNAANTLIENNQASLTAPTFAKLSSDGIRVYGYLGKKMVVRHNHTSGFTRDVHVRALLPTGPKHDAVYWYTNPPAIGTNNTNLWLVADNVVESNNIDAQACLVADNWP